MFMYHLSVNSLLTTWTCWCDETCFSMIVGGSLADQEIALLRSLRTLAASSLLCGATTLVPRMAPYVRTVQSFGILMKLL